MISLALWTAIAAAAPLLPTDYFVLAPTYDPTGPVTVDTDAGTIGDGTDLYVGTVDPVSGGWVFTFGDVVLDEVLTAVGSRGFALLSQGDLRVTSAGRIEASAPPAPYAYAFVASPPPAPSCGGRPSPDTSARASAPTS